MSMIHRSCVLVGRSSVLSDGTARFRTVRSIEYNRQGSASTARPSHSRRVAFAEPLLVMSMAASPQRMSAAAGVIVTVAGGISRKGGKDLLFSARDVQRRH